MADLLDLARALEKKKKLIDESASALAVDTAEKIVKDLVLNTPVDTSNALSNWIVTLGSKATGVIPPHYLGSRGSTQKTSASEAINNARKQLKSKKVGQSIFITNNVDYIGRLNDGYSRQAPAGFVERAVLIGRKNIKNFKIKG
jgi:hypothetical protein